MALNEFALIERYFSRSTSNRQDVILGIGDDGALLQVPSNYILAASMDTLVAGQHFPIDTSPHDIGYKSLAVNLSDLAAMGAQPSWLMLALTMPDNNAVWLEEFSGGLFELADLFNMQLVGGDTTRGPLTITVQVQGFVPVKQALCRHGAMPGDKIYVSGTLGDAGLGLQVALGKRQIESDEKNFLLQRLNRPTPRVELGLLLRGLATSAIDISDGLFADLSHILSKSKVGARIFADQLPLSTALRSQLPLQEAYRYALVSGDDYELCFTVPPEHESEFLLKISQQNTLCSCIGEICVMPGLEVVGFSEKIIRSGFQHF